MSFLNLDKSPITLVIHLSKLSPFHPFLAPLRHYFSPQPVQLPTPQGHPRRLVSACLSHFLTACPPADTSMTPSFERITQVALRPSSHPYVSTPTQTPPSRIYGLFPLYSPGFSQHLARLPGRLYPSSQTLSRHHHRYDFSGDPHRFL